MPKIDIDAIPVKTGSGYPAPFGQMFEGRRQYRLGVSAGLHQFGVNLVKLDPGAMSSLRHWHENQDEFLVVTAGELTLVDDKGETVLAVGDCAAFPAGDANGHHLVNRSDRVGAFIVVGTTTKTETAWYSDIDMKVQTADGSSHFTRQNGDPLPVPVNDFAAISENLTKALVNNDLELYRSLFQLPVTIVPREGIPYLLSTEEEFAEDFRLYAQSMQLNHVTDIFREVQSKEISKNGLKHVRARVHLLNNANRVVAPFETNFYLSESEDGWRIVRIESSLGHINWTLGMARITPDQTFEDH